VAGVDGAQPADLAVVAHMYAAIAVHDDAPARAAYLVGLGAALIGIEDCRGYTTSCARRTEPGNCLAHRRFRWSTNVVRPSRVTPRSRLCALTRLRRSHGSRQPGPARTVSALMGRLRHFGRKVSTWARKPGDAGVRGAHRSTRCNRPVGRGRSDGRGFSA
jgi:hypothetical protein